MNAALAIKSGKSGVMVAIQNVAKEISEWRPVTIDLEHALVEEVRHGKLKKVIAKALVDLNGPVFKAFEAVREQNRLHDNYKRTGPIQFSGPLKSLITKTLSLET